MSRPPGPSVRLRLTLSYAGFLLIAGVLLLTAVWVFLLRRPLSRLPIPTPADFTRVFDPTNFGPSVFVPAALLVMGFLLIFGLLGGWFLAGRMLAPLSRITAATRTAETGSLSHRIALEGHRDEFRELADAFDTMLARLESQVGEQRRFAANASHELRTPLATMQSMLEVAQNAPQTNNESLHSRLRAVNARAIALTEALLLLSRSEQGVFDPVAVDLSLLVDEAVETLLPLAEANRTRIDARGDTALVSGSPALLLQLTTNLVHNAIVHNLPADGSVQVSTARDRSDVVLRVENPGTRVDPAVVSTLTEPFSRGTDRVRAGQVGAGLGLAIVTAIVRAHHGRITLDPLEPGGLCVEVRLPAAPDVQPQSGTVSLSS